MALAAYAAFFVLAAAVLTRGGSGLARAGDALAQRAGWSHLVVGMLLVATATSLPELVTDVAAAAADAPDIAVGDLFGSSMANMAILAVIDLVHRGRVWPRIERTHSRVGAMAIALTAVAAMAILTPPGPSIGWVGLDTLAIAAGYLAAVTWVRRSTTAPVVTQPTGLPAATGWDLRREGSAGQAALDFARAAALVLVSAPVVAWTAREIAQEAGVGETFVGATIVAVATSLPELMASLAAVRIGAHDLAVGNLFGSNAANMALLAVVDVAYRPGPLLAPVDPAQVIAALAAITLMGTAVAAIVLGEETRLGRAEPDALFVLFLYAAGLGAVWAGAG